MTVQENEEDSESLLDVQRGEQEDNDGDDEDADATYNAKPAKKYIKNNFKDDDTIPSPLAQLSAVRPKAECTPPSTSGKSSCSIIQ